VNYFIALARTLLPWSVMTPLTVANRLLEPLTHPWAVLVAAVTPGDPAVWQAAKEMLQLAVRLLHLVLAL